MPAIAVPIIAAGIGTAGSIYAANKMAGATKDATAASSQIAQQQLGLANRLLASGMPKVDAASGYYNTLLRGDRSAMRQAVAGPTAALTDQYRGAERSLERSGVQGGVRDLAKAELSRDRANSIAQLTTGQQGKAAASLADLGTNLIAGGGTNLSGAAETAGGVMRSKIGASQFQYGADQQTGAAVGSLIFDILRGGMGGWKSPLPSRSTVPTDTVFTPGMASPGV